MAFIVGQKPCYYFGFATIRVLDDYWDYNFGFIFFLDDARTTLVAFPIFQMSLNSLGSATILVLGDFWDIIKGVIFFEILQLPQ